MKVAQNTVKGCNPQSMGPQIIFLFQVNVSIVACHGRQWHQEKTLNLLPPSPNLTHILLNLRKISPSHKNEAFSLIYR